MNQWIYWINKWIEWMKYMNSWILIEFLRLKWKNEWDDWNIIILNKQFSFSSSHSIEIFSNWIEREDKWGIITV